MFRFQRIQSSFQTSFSSRINPSSLNLTSSFHCSSAMSSPSTSSTPPLNLIPITAPSQSALFPFPGFTHKSAETVRKLLDDNHKVRQHQIGLEMSYLLIRLSLCTHIPRLNLLCPFLSLFSCQTYHCFFNDSHFHNHLIHHLLASLSLGSPPSFFSSIWEKEQSDLNPSFHLNKKPVSPPLIDESNWFNHLDNASRYWPLLSFFDQEISKNGVRATLEKFVFSQVGEENHMIDRLVGGAVHPLIHIGYGVEFKIGGIVAEGESLLSRSLRVDRRVD